MGDLVANIIGDHIIMYYYHCEPVNSDDELEGSEF